jgi:hypothetical protein
LISFILQYTLTTNIIHFILNKDFIHTGTILLTFTLLFSTCSKPVATHKTDEILQITYVIRVETVDNISVNWTLPTISGTAEAEAFSLSLLQESQKILQQLISEHSEGEYFLTYTQYNDENSNTLSFLVNDCIFLGGAHGISTNRAYVLNSKTASLVEFNDLYTPQAIAFIEKRINQEIQTNLIL